MSNNEDKNKNIIEKIKRIMLSNPILYAFTKGYKTETEYIEFMKKHIDSFKLLPGSETEDEIMERLINMSKVESKYQNLALACHTYPEIQLNVNKPATQVEQKPNKKIELTRTNDSILGSSKLPESCNYEIEKYSALAYDKFEEEQGPILKKTRK